MVTKCSGKSNSNNDKKFTPTSLQSKGSVKIGGKACKSQGVKLIRSSIRATNNMVLMASHPKHTYVSFNVLLFCGLRANFSKCKLYTHTIKFAPKFMRTKTFRKFSPLLQRRRDLDFH
ncbi:unnamed protein product [Ceratitis capitata]|uniref:(Mediterranean fruit fly) hypothetical protein n=1 Tax=Ceratitis capitata TaxID=7213 RepID=A0A811VDB7_CERCA|nr:unnamed protein product [Ceratitis capitata]